MYDNRIMGLLIKTQLHNIEKDFQIYPYHRPNQNTTPPPSTANHMTYERFSSQHEQQLAQIPVKCSTADRDRPVLDDKKTPCNMHVSIRIRKLEGNMYTYNTHIQAITVFTLISAVVYSSMKGQLNVKSRTCRTSPSNIYVTIYTTPYDHTYS